MSNLWFNLRLGGLFIQISRNGPFLGINEAGREVFGSRWRFSRVPNRPGPDEPWLQLYELRWPL